MCFYTLYNHEREFMNNSINKEINIADDDSDTTENIEKSLVNLQSTYEGCGKKELNSRFACGTVLFGIQKICSECRTEWERELNEMRAFHVNMYAHKLELATQNKEAISLLLGTKAEPLEVTRKRRRSASSISQQHQSEPQVQTAYSNTDNPPAHTWKTPEPPAPTSRAYRPEHDVPSNPTQKKSKLAERDDDRCVRIKYNRKHVLERCKNASLKSNGVFCSDCKRYLAAHYDKDIQIRTIDGDETHSIKWCLEFLLKNEKQDLMNKA